MQLEQHELLLTIYVWHKV